MMLHTMRALAAHGRHPAPVTSHWPAPSRTAPASSGRHAPARRVLRGMAEELLSARSAAAALHRTLRAAATREVPYV